MTPTFQCPKCTAVFTRQNALSCHLRQSTIHREDVPPGKRFCNEHNAWLPIEEFYPSQVKKRIRYWCKVHQNKINYIRQMNNPSGYSKTYGAITAQRSYWRNRIRVILKLGGKCVCCPQIDVRVLQINHKNGGGNREQISRWTNKNSLIISILDGTRQVDDLEIRCANCNVLQEYESGRRSVPYGMEAEIRAEFESKVLKEGALTQPDAADRPAGEHPEVSPNG